VAVYSARTVLAYSVLGDRDWHCDVGRKQQLSRCVRIASSRPDVIMDIAAFRRARALRCGSCIAVEARESWSPRFKTS